MTINKRRSQIGLGVAVAAALVASYGYMQPASQTLRFASRAPAPAVVVGANSSKSGQTPTGEPGGIRLASKVDVGSSSSYVPLVRSSSNLPVTLSVAKGSLAVCQLSNGVVNFEAVGTCILDASQSGGHGFAPATSISQVIKVVKNPQVITFTSSAPSGAVIGDNYTPTASASSGLPVTLTVASASASVCSLSAAGVVHLSAAGTCTLDANQVGNADYLTAVAATQSFAVTIYTPPPPARYGASSGGGGSSTHYNYLWSPNTDLSVGVGIYSDCTGVTPLTHAEAAIDTCMPGLYFVGHGVAGLFGPLLSLGNGDKIYYWNGAGQVTIFTITQTLTVAWPGGDVWYPGAAAEFQTCTNAAGTIDRLLVTS